MKLNFNLLPFKSQLLIDNRGKAKGFKKLIPAIKENFSKDTSDYNDTLILTTVKSQDEDNFELINEFGETTALYKTNFSKYAATSDSGQLSSRLNTIYQLMQLQESFNVIIKSLKGYREKCILELSSLRSNNSIPSADKNNRMSVLETVIGYLNRDLEYHFKVSKAECDSFELSHGLKEDLN